MSEIDAVPLKRKRKREEKQNSTAKDEKVTGKEKVDMKKKKKKKRKNEDVRAEETVEVEETAPSLSEPPPQDQELFALGPEFSDDSADENDDHEEKKHRNVLSSIASLSGSAKKKKVQRAEPSSQMSEFNMMTAGEDKTNLTDLLKTLQGSQQSRELRKKLNVMRQDIKTVEPNLTKPQTERVQRSAAFQTTSKEVTKWQPTIKRNREAPHLEFPIQEYVPPVPSVRGMAASFKPRTELEKAVFAVLDSSDGRHEFQRDGLTPSEAETLRQMDLEEAKERRAELQKLRALASYYEQKCRRKSKIKSRKFRRLHRQAKQPRTSIEELAAANPELARDELEKAERLRAKERMTLKHGNQSKWAKGLLTRRHKDSASRQLLADNLRKGRELLTKRVEVAASDNNESPVSSDDDELETTLVAEVSTSDNPWMSRGTPVVETSKGNKRKAPPGKGQPVLMLDTAKNEGEVEAEDFRSDSDGEDETCEDKDEDNCESDNSESGSASQFVEPAWQKDSSNEDEGSKEETSKLILAALPEQPEADSDEQINALKLQIDTSKVLSIDETSDSDARKSAAKQKMAIAEAFASDDVIAEFAAAKVEDMKETAPKVVDLTLPGWGSWTGDGARPSRRPRPRIVKHTGSTEPRADRKLAHVIISQKPNKKLAEHQVKSLPHPFTSWKQWERTMSVPVGREWNTENSFRAHVRPAVETKMGTIIAPMRATKETKKKTTQPKKKKRGNHDDILTLSV